MEDGLGDKKKSFYADSSVVLILVLVEDGLGDFKNHHSSNTLRIVLILVLVEDGLGELEGGILLPQSRVLILVLVEDGLGDVWEPPYEEKVTES